ncbi:TPA: type II toxin-antitoxin system VapC family toxin [Candidatus Micrarchaeota archaeon]|nr:type II toxin-antitoxin system VapC family toxin [Candidatus Micrarchaeota archaeon]
MFVLDSDLLVSALRNKADAVSALEKFQMQSCCTTSVNALELLAGAFASKRESNVSSAKALLSALPLIEFDYLAAEKTALFQAALQEKGQMLEIRDALIAGIASSRGAILVTRNLKHFNRVPGLKVVKW